MDEDCVAREALGRQWMMAWKGATFAHPSRG